MKRYTKKMFLAEKPNQDRVIAIRIKDGEFYFLAWMENAEHYRIQAAQNSNGYLMDKGFLLSTGDIYEAVQSTEEYNSMDVLYQIDDYGDAIDTEYTDEYDRFLSLFAFGEFAQSRTNYWFHIIGLSSNELQDFGETFRDGDYIFIMNEPRTNEDAEAFMQKCYEAYQLEWMLSHGYSLEETINVVGDIVTEHLEDPENEFPEEAFEVSNTIYKCYEQFGNEVGFQGEIFACKEEFLKEEFLSATYMDRLLSLMPEPAKKKALWKKIVEGGAADEQ